MVVKMHSRESNSLPASRPPLAADLRLPVFVEAQREHWPSPMSWSEAVRHFASARSDYMKRFDSPEARLHSKNPARFTLAS